MSIHRLKVIDGNLFRPRKDGEKGGGKFVKIAEKGAHADGGGLYARATPRAGGDGVSISWVFKYTPPCAVAEPGKRIIQREMGLGSYPGLGLEPARKEAERLRALVTSGVDPMAARGAEKVQAVKAAREKPKAAVTFRECAEAHIKAVQVKWKNPKHAAQWPATLAAYAYPKIGAMDVAEVTIDDIEAVLKPIWHNKPETAKRVRMRLEAVFDRAISRRERSADNPASLRMLVPHRLGHQDATVRHMPSLDYSKMKAFIADLRSIETVTARCLEFAILSGVRSNEVFLTEWSEIDFDAAVWTIPAKRMKRTRTVTDHFVPLAPRALAILNELPRLGSPLVFPGQAKGRPLSNMAMTMLCRRLGYFDDQGQIIVPHGFRATFRSWAADDVRGFEFETVEKALAHNVGNAVSRAYNRAAQLTKRRELMNAWAEWCEPCEVVALAERAA